MTYPTKFATVSLMTLVAGFSLGSSLLSQSQDAPPPPERFQQQPGGGGPGGPPGMGRGGFGPMQQERQLVKQFDKDGNGRLNAEERKKAREFLKQEAAEGRGGGRRGGFGFGGRGGNQEPPVPGPKLTPAEVKSYPTAPLYDPQTLRTIFLEFEDSDWEKEMAEFNNTDVEMPAKLIVDGKTYREVGVHFRGMSSFGGVPEGRKRSMNIALDFTDKNQKIGGYHTLNLLNSHEDPTFLRAVLYYQIAREYIPAPKANFVRLVVNGESWGIYINAQQFNKDFVKDWFGTTKGSRWKVPGSPGGRGSLAYLGDDPAQYKRVYQIKTKDEPKPWADLIKLCKVLNETPPEQLEKALEPLLDIDGALKFLALENALINNDGYWIRTSDYSIYQDDKRRFHFVPHDANETFLTPGGPGFGGGPGGRRGGPGGVGPSGMLSSQILAQADKNADKKVSKEEFTALADAWFDKLDPKKTGKLTEEEFVANFQEVLPPGQPGFGPPGEGPRGGPPGGDVLRGGPEGPGGRGGFGPGMFVGPILFRAVDVNKDNTVTRTELKETFAKWATDWDPNKSGSLNEDQLRQGLTAAFPQQNVFVQGGPGGPPGERGPGSGRGFGGGGGPRPNGVELDPLVAAKDSNKPLLSKLLAVPALRERYLGYVRDIAEKWLDWNKLGPIAQQYHSLIAEDVKADTRKLDSTEGFMKGLTENSQTGRGTISLKNFADQRRAYLLKQTQSK